MGVFQNTIKNFAPPWFLNRWMGTLLESVGATLDIQAQRVFDGRRAGNPYAGGSMTDGGILRECDPDALAYHSRDRGIRLYATEGLLSQRIRLSQWHQLHKARGTHFGEIEHVRPYFADFAAAGGSYPTIRIVFQDNAATPGATWHTIDPAGVHTVVKQSTSNWNWDNQPTKRSRWWAIIHVPSGFAAFRAATGDTWDSSGVWDGSGIWDVLPTAVLADLWSMMNEWKGAHSWFAGLIVTTLQPTDVIPGQSVHPFDPASSSTTNSNTSTNLPTGGWGSPVWTSGANIGLPSRPGWATFYNISNG